MRLLDLDIVSWHGDHLMLYIGMMAVAKGAQIREVSACCMHIANDREVWTRRAVTRTSTTFFRGKVERARGASNECM